MAVGSQRVNEVVESRYTAHLDVRTILGGILWVTGFLGVAMLVSGLSLMPSSIGWGELVAGVALLCAFVGLWRAREWARWAAGFIAIAYVIWFVASLFFEGLGSRWTNAVFALPGLGWMSFMIWYSFRPATKRRFAQAREAIARAKVTRGQ